MVIDDDGFMRQLAREVLEGIGLQVVEAGDGVAGLAALASVRPDIVLLDVGMPGLDGVEVCRALRRQHAGQGIPVLMFTAHDDGATVDGAFAAGATDYMCKPINNALLQHRMRILLQSSPVRRAADAGADAGTLLLVDHDPNVIRSLRRLFRADDYQLLCAPTAGEAFDLLGSHRVQVMIADQRLPQVCGADFLSKVKLQYPEVVRIVLSGYTQVDSVIDAINHGSVFRFFTKPWDDQAVRDSVREAFEHQRKANGHGARRRKDDFGSPRDMADRTMGFSI
ncbi:response regulator [Massilia glaciei]|uniref:response regulator n=1 Tax=Massilia glaciei TaxID=1524097 RepID=UPI0015E7FBAD|nr:response regulator [Massilia glaciei]